MEPMNAVNKKNKKRLVRFCSAFGILSFSGGVSLLVIGGNLVLTIVLGSIFVFIGIMLVTFAVMQWAKYL